MTEITTSKEDETNNGEEKQTEKDLTEKSNIIAKVFML